MTAAQKRYRKRKGDQKYLDAVNAGSKKWKKLNREKVMAAQRKQMKRNRDELSDWYIKNQLAQVHKIKNPSPELIELKRLSLKLKRLIKKVKR